MASPPARASSWSGIQSPVKTTVSHAITVVLPSGRRVTSTASTRAPPRIRVSSDPARMGMRWRRAVSQAKGS